MRAVFYKGVHLWEHWEDWNPQGQRTDDVTHVGVAQKRAYHEPGSPGFERDIVVQTYISPMEGTDDLDPETALDALLNQLEDELIGLSDTKGPLSYAMNADMRAVVSGGPYAAAGSVSHGSIGAGWVPVAGRYVLLRNPSDGSGFVATISSVGSGSLTLAAASGETWQTVSSGWEIVYVQQVIPAATFSGLNRGSRDDALAGKAHRRGVEYQFKSAAEMQHATAHAIPRGNN